MHIFGVNQGNCSSINVRIVIESAIFNDELIVPIFVLVIFLDAECTTPIFGVSYKILEDC